jgi:predicted Zn-dependent peptidase
MDLSAVGGGADAPPPTEHVRRQVCDHGAVVLTDTVESSSLAAVSVWLGVGSRDEPDEVQGVSHFLEHLLFKGTGDTSALEIAQVMDRVGGELNAYTASEHTVFHARVPAGELDVALEVLFGVVTEAALRAEDVDAERQVILEELAVALDDPEDVAAVRLFEAAFDGHPLGREVLGTETSIAELRRDEIASFRDAWYRPGDLVVAAAGRIDHDALVARVDRAFGAWAGGTRPERTAPSDAVVPEVSETQPGEVSHLARAWRTCSARDDERYVLAVLNHILGGGPSSRLFQHVREQRSLTYAVSSAVSLYSDAGVLSLQCSASTDRFDALCGAVDDVIGALRDGGVSEAEVSQAVSSLRGATVMGLDDVGARMSRLAASELLHGQVTPVADHLQRLAQVRAEDVSRLAAVLLADPGVRSVVVAD